MSLYYQDESVTLYCGDSLEVLPTLDVEAAVLLTDPPYFKVKQEEWDNQWDKAHEFLEWMGDFLDRAKPLLAANASVWVFASPAMTSSVERLIAERFRVLNSIRWVKPGGNTLKRVSMPAMRSYVSIWEGIIFAEQFESAYQPEHKALEVDRFAPIGHYLHAERLRANVTRSEVRRIFLSASGGETNALTNWERGSNLPSEAQYLAMRDLFNSNGGNYLLKDYKDLRAQHVELRRPFQMSERHMSTDVWGFPSVPRYPGKHSCEKPKPMLRHMIETSSRPGDLILDPFAGSGSTLDAARQTGRKAIGIEKDEQWCEKIATRLSQSVLDFSTF